MATVNAYAVFVIMPQGIFKGLSAYNAGRHSFAGGIHNVVPRGGENLNIGNLTVTIHTSNIKYARGVEEGTRPHIIKAKNKKALYWKGARHPVKSVRHPGSRAKPFLIPAFEKEKNNLINDLRKVIEW